MARPDGVIVRTPSSSQCGRPCTRTRERCLSARTTCCSTPSPPAGMCSVARTGCRASAPRSRTRRSAAWSAISATSAAAKAHDEVVRVGAPPRLQGGGPRVVPATAGGGPRRRGAPRRLSRCGSGRVVAARSVRRLASLDPRPSRRQARTERGDCPVQWNPDPVRGRGGHAFRCGRAVPVHGRAGGEPCGRASRRRGDRRRAHGGRGHPGFRVPLWRRHGAVPAVRVCAARRGVVLQYQFAQQARLDSDHPRSPPRGMCDWPPVRVLGDVTRYANCQSCHGSQIVAVFDTAQRRYDTRLTALSVNCESCHGPGRRHVELARSGEIRRSSDIGMRPLATLGKDASLEVCYQCHSLKDVLETGYLPGRPLADYYSLGLPQLGDHPLLPDGRVRTFAYQETQRYSDCYRNGAMKCVDCHDPHSQGYRDVNGAVLPDRSSDGQCTSCHQSKAERPEAHTHHRANSTGSRCVACHMPYLQEPEVGHAIRYARSDHTIPIPRPVADEAEGVTSACRQCHVGETPDGLEAQVHAWYGSVKPPSAVLGQFVGLAQFFEDSLAPDMPSLSGEIVRRLEQLGHNEDVDVRALALAGLHLARGEDPAVRRFLARELEGLGARDDAIRKRWSVALGFVADGYRT